MTYIRAYALSIIAIVLFSVLLEIMMPSGNFKKYIKLVAGLLVMFVLIRPIVKLPALEQTLAAFHVSTETFMTQSEAVRDRLTHAQEEQIAGQFSDNLEQTIQEGILTAFQISCTVTAVFDGKTVTRLLIETPEKAAEIKQFVKSSYGLDAEVTVGGDGHA